MVTVEDTIALHDKIGREANDPNLPSRKKQKKTIVEGITGSEWSERLQEMAHLVPLWTTLAAPTGSGTYSRAGLLACDHALSPPAFLALPPKPTWNASRGSSRQLDGP